MLLFQRSVPLLGSSNKRPDKGKEEDSNSFRQNLLVSTYHPYQPAKFLAIILKHSVQATQESSTQKFPSHVGTFGRSKYLRNVATPAHVFIVSDSTLKSQSPGSLPPPSTWNYISNIYQQFRNHRWGRAERDTYQCRTRRRLFFIAEQQGTLRGRTRQLLCVY